LNKGYLLKFEKSDSFFKQAVTSTFIGGQSSLVGKKLDMKLKLILSIRYGI